MLGGSGMEGLGEWAHKNIHKKLQYTVITTAARLLDEVHLDPESA